LVFLITPSFVLGQAPSNDSVRTVEICEVLKNPSAFDSQMIRLRGRLELEFENETVDDRACGLPVFHTGIWWTYGGEPLLAHEPDGKRIRALAWPVLKDAQFNEFEARARERRKHLPDGEWCHSHWECAYYDVVATFTGKFFAGKKHPGRTLAGGFGHMGCCHLFVIEQISDVVAQRTQVPFEERQFSCTSNTWQSEYPTVSVSGIDWRAATNRQFLADEMRAHGDASLVDALQQNPSWGYLALTGYLVWSSPDLLTTYTVELPHRLRSGEKRHEPQTTAGPLIVNVTREHCEAIAN